MGAADGAALGAADGAPPGAVLVPPDSAANALATLCSGRGTRFPANRNELCVSGFDTVIREPGFAADCAAAARAALATPAGVAALSPCLRLAVVG